MCAIATPECDLYEGVFYCAKCGYPKHLVRILRDREKCSACGFGEFMSHRDFDVMKIMQQDFERSWEHSKGVF